MISFRELNAFASRAITGAAPSETDLRRAISALYYGLFHRLTAAGATMFGAGGRPLRSQAAQAFNHSSMRSLCEKYLRSQTQPLRPPLDRLIPNGPHPRLVEVAEAFIELQNARHAADYDVDALVTGQQAVDMLALASNAHVAFSLIEGPPEAAVFLTALLLADRWTRSG